MSTFEVVFALFEVIHKKMTQSKDSMRTPPKEEEMMMMVTHSGEEEANLCTCGGFVVI